MSKEQNTLSPAHIEDGEEVEVVAHLIIPEKGSYKGRQFAASGPVPADSSPLKHYEPLMTVAQHQRIVAALSAPPAAGAPEGWKLVPVEPTQEMWAAFRNTDHGNIWFHQAYRAMFAAAPAPPASEQPEPFMYAVLVNGQRTTEGSEARCREWAAAWNDRKYNKPEHPAIVIPLWQTVAQASLAADYWHEQYQALRKDWEAKNAASEQQQAVVMPERCTEHAGDRDNLQWARGANWMHERFLRLNPHLQPAAPSQGGDL